MQTSQLTSNVIPGGHSSVQSVVNNRGSQADQDQGGQMPKAGQIGTKWDKSETFLDQYSPKCTEN